MKKQSLMRRLLTQYVICVAILMVLATPLFYLLTKNFYAEDMMDIIDAVQQGRPVPTIDLEEDILHGIMLQFVLIAGVMGIALVLMMRFISKRLWQPFDKTLLAMKSFKLETGTIPKFTDTEIKEFSQLNIILNKLMTDSLHSYHIQKEFTENASHELQTPLAVFQSKLDILLQQPDITERQASIIQDLYQMNNRLSHLSRNLLLLAKMENRQFGKEKIEVITILNELKPYLENISEDIRLKTNLSVNSLQLTANSPLFESMLNNLIVNAVRHNKASGEIVIDVKSDSLTISNTSNEPVLDSTLIFNRFYRQTECSKGNGLGLAIVKAICDYHNWKITYSYIAGWHKFTITFS